MGYITLDCRDYVHEPCEFCHCHCHEGVEVSQVPYGTRVAVSIALAIGLVLGMILGLLLSGLFW